jgi:DNA-binding transcriptional LysR family regulator
VRRSTTRQLQIFSAVARNKSFTRAAEELCLTQSSVSTQIKQLTEFTGHPLIEQIGKKIIITQVGERVAQLYEDLDRDWHKFEEDMESLTSPTKGIVNVACVNTCQYFFPRVLGSFFNRYSDIFVSLKVFNRQQVLERIAGNTDDLYIMGYIPEELELKAVSFVENPLVVVAHPEHPLATKKNIPIDMLSGEKFIAREPGSGTRREISQFLEESHVSINSQIELGSNEAIKQGIMGGLGISILSMYAVALELRLGMLTTLDVEGFPRMRQWHIAYHSGKVITPVVRTFINYLKDEGRKIVGTALENTHVTDSIAMVEKQLKTKE